MTIPITSRLKLGAKFNVNLKDDVVSGPLSTHEHPKSFINKIELNRAKQRIQNTDWASAYWRQLETKADELLDKDITVPADSGGHMMWYLSDGGERLNYDSNSPHKHYCPSEGNYYTGPSYDKGWLYFRHNQIVDALKTLVTSYGLSSDRRYAEKAKSILVGYANRYPGFPKQTRGGRMYWQTLDEAISMITISYSYDLLYNSGVLTNEDKANIELNLLRPSAKTISDYDMGKSNWQAWHDAAIGMIGFVVGDKYIIDFAINGQHGFYYLMENSVMNDGFWWEGSMAYHMYALRAFVYLAEGAKNWDYDLYANQKLKSMLAAPINYAYPDLSIPCHNDGGHYGESLLTNNKGNELYEIADAYYKNPLYAWMHTEKYKRRQRTGDFALFKGRDNIPTILHPSLKSKDFNDMGHGILRASNGDNQHYVLMDYGPFGGTHGHPDKLHIDVFGADQPLAPDFGTPNYGHPYYRTWYKQTVSHNTVVVDEKSQKQVGGQLNAFIDMPSFKMINANADKVYSVAYTRSVFLTKDYLVDWFTTGSKLYTHQYDWVFHGLADFTTNETLLKQAGSLGERNGYQYITDLSSFETSSQGWEGVFTQGHSQLQFISLPFGNRTVFIGKAPGPSNHPNTKTPMIIQRIKGKSASFVTVMKPKKDNEPYLHVNKIDTHTIRVNGAKQSDIIYYNNQANPYTLFTAKMTINKNEAFSHFDDVLSAVDRNDHILNLSIKSQVVLTDVTLVYKGILNRLTVNGYSVKPIYNNHLTIIQLKRVYLGVPSV